MRRSPILATVAIAALATGVGIGFATSGLATSGAEAPETTPVTAALVPTASPAASDGVAAPTTGTTPSFPPAEHPDSTPTSSPAPTPYDGPMTRVVPVLMYHLIGDPSPGTRYPGLYVNTVDFTAQLRALSGRGWRTITAADLGAAMAANRPVPARTIVLTFDDGNVDNYTTAFPILERFGFRATFYMVAAGGGSRMTVAELATMAQAGMEIGNHTMRHRNVSRLSQAKLDFQIAGAALRIEAELAAQGVVARLRTFVYPAGHASATAEAYLAGRHYTAAFTEGPGVVRIGYTDPLRAPRLRVSRFTTLRDFLAMLPVEPMP
jgi:peptidoglycan/xylan/chitin deacetylase (PgdA/CDA1 family)